MQFVFPPRPAVSVPVAGRDARFPVNRIYCVGRNYAAHIREMGFDPDREPPFFFMKPSDALVGSEAVVPYPLDTQDFQHEIELVVAIGTAGRNITADRAYDHVWGYAVGVDLTRRDRQIEARNRGRPWEAGKSFDLSAPMSTIVAAEAVGDVKQGRIWLSVNGQMRQDGDLSQMIWSVAEVIEKLSASWELQPGDLIFSGTPEGVGPLQPGDRVDAGISGVGEVRFRIA